jgi:hypothetical protein
MMFICNVEPQEKKKGLCKRRKIEQNKETESKKMNKKPMPLAPPPKLSHPTLNLTHTWQNKFAYVVRPGGKLVRCEIHQMSINEGEVSLACRFNADGKSHFKAFSPSHIAAAFFASKTDKAVSSDDEDDERLSKPIPPPLSMLPLLRCTNIEALEKQQQKKLMWHVNQTNNFLSLLSKTVDQN